MNVETLSTGAEGIPIAVCEKQFLPFRGIKSRGACLMNRILFFLISIVLTGNALCAEEAKKEVGAPTAKVAAMPQETPPARLRLSVGAGLAWHNSDVAKTLNTDLGKLGETLDLGVYFRVAPVPLFVGLNFGLNHWGVKSTYGSGATSDLNVFALPMLPTVLYIFEVSRVFHPFIGLSAGPSLYVVNSSTTSASGTTSTSDTTSRVVFEGLVRPGVDLQFSKRFGLSLEPRFGTLDKSFYFMSTAAATFSF